MRKNYIFFLISDASSRNNDNSGSFSSIFSAIGNQGYAAVNALMGGAAATPTNEERAGRSSKSRRRMNGFDVRKVPVMGVGGRSVNQFGMTTPRAIGQASPTHFSDMLDILQNGQRQGVLVFRSGSGLGISSPHPPVNSNNLATSATERTFFSDPNPSPFPFDRRVHQRQGPAFNSQQLQATPNSFSAPPSSSFFPSQTSTFNTGGGGGALSSVPAPNAFSASQQPSFASLRFPEEQSAFRATPTGFSGTPTTSTTTINQLINQMGFQSGAATPAEQLQIQVVEQQNLGKLKTSNSFVQQQTFQKPKSLLNFCQAILHFLNQYP